MGFIVLTFTNSKFENTLKEAQSEMINWISRLDKSYADQFILFGKPITTTPSDAAALAQSCDRWIDVIKSSFNEDGTILINSENFAEVFPNEMITKLDPMTQHDLREGIYAIFNFLPTASAMILLRAGEDRMMRPLFA